MSTVGWMAARMYDCGCGNRSGGGLTRRVRFFGSIVFMRIDRKRIACTVLAVSTIAFGLLAAPAGAEVDKPGGNVDPAAGSNAAREIMDAQRPLVQAAQRLTDIDREGNLGGVYIEAQRRTLRLWWKGEPAPEIREEIERQQADNDIRIDLRPSQYSQRELLAVISEVKTRWEAYPGLTRVGPRVDGSGLQVGTTKVKDLDPALFGVPVTVTQDPGLQALSRANDSAPWYGGAVTRAVTSSGSCSTGFAVARYTLWWETTRGILTAEHCALGGGVNFVDGAGELIGMAEFAPTLHDDSDSLLIRTSTSPRIFDGGVGVNEFTKPVTGQVGNFAGQWVCTSGAGTGVHCNIKTDSINNAFMLVPPNLIVSSIALASQQQGSIAAGSGDSGGPVFTLASDPNKVMAAGLLVGGATPQPCLITGPTTCFNTVAFVDINYILGAHNARLLTQ